jgi:membrane-associated phospholipid phosphatase
VACIAGILVVSTVSSAEEGVSGNGTATTFTGKAGPQGPRLRYDLPIDLSITAGGAALALSLELLTPKIAPSTCRWCDRDGNGNDALNNFDASIRSRVRWSNTAAADKASTVIGYGLVPLSVAGIGWISAQREDRMAEFPVSFLIVAESAVLAVNVNQLTKLAFARERPEVHSRSPEERAAQRSSEDNLSFYSGHTTFAFAVATSAGTIASMCRYRLAPVMWAAGMLLATTTGYLRIAADKHYASDVIAGAVVGSAIGVGVPYFGHRPTRATIRVTAAPIAGGTALMLSGTW